MVDTDIIETLLTTKNKNNHFRNDFQENYSSSQKTWSKINRKNNLKISF